MSRSRLDTKCPISLQDWRGRLCKLRHILAVYSPLVSSLHACPSKRLLSHPRCNHLLNYRLSNGQSSWCFIIPLIYANPDSFNDITSGTNPGCGTNGFKSGSGVGSGYWVRCRQRPAVWPNKSLMILVDVLHRLSCRVLSSVSHAVLVASTS
ncbi:hypothetical protein BDZ89DRAFT_1065916 [Hymenopellis radicata]|nr:hypothetical protein BDZ89DRAFT_1065916 [Hymenopellis radicata]